MSDHPHKNDAFKAKGAVATKHNKVLRKMSANVGKKGKISISQAARDAGYSASSKY